MSLELLGVSAPPLVGVSLQLGAGAWTFLGAPDDGTATLVELASGMIRPRLGRVLVAGADPRRSPELRRRIASLQEREEPLPGRRVRDKLRAALALHGVRAEAEAALAKLGLERWAERRATELGPRERRSLALAIALAIPEPLLVALHEPLAITASVDRALVRRQLSELAAAGSVVICTTASVRDALELGGRTLVLNRGRIVRELTNGTLDELVPGSPAELVVRTGAARELAAALASERNVVAVQFDARFAPGQLRVRGADLDLLALDVARVARAHGIHLQAVAQSLPSVQEVRAASAGVARAAYDEAYRVAVEQARIAAAAPVVPAAGPSESGGGS
jgi:ABC-type multidrug transport system ATPase subunit